MIKRQMDIERLVEWAFREQRVEDAVRALFPGAGSGSTVSGLLQVMQLGTRVDTSSAGERFAGIRCHEDAAVIYDGVMVIMGRVPEAGMLLAQHGRTGTRPDWCHEGYGREVEVLDKRGKHKKLWRDADKQRGFLGYAYRWEGHRPETVDFHRAQWAVWHAALADLAALVAGELVAHEVTGPRVEAIPWDVAAADA